jgi:hypothetical protein
VVPLHTHPFPTPAGRTSLYFRVVVDFSRTQATQKHFQSTQSAAHSTQRASHSSQHDVFSGPRRELEKGHVSLMSILQQEVKSTLYSIHSHFPHPNHFNHFQCAFQLWLTCVLIKVPSKTSKYGEGVIFDPSTRTRSRPQQVGKIACWVSTHVSRTPLNTSNNASHIFLAHIYICIYNIYTKIYIWVPNKVPSKVSTLHATPKSR